MELVKPAIGLIFWMSLTFLIVLFILKKFAWTPILSMIKERETSIETALSSARKAKEEMSSLQQDNERLLAQARADRDALLKEARETKDAIINEAKGKATTEANRLIASARETINTEKIAAINELKNQVASMSIEIAEKIIRNELTNDEKQKALVANLLKEVTLN
jgi:F-type H+-transporting ATPase subunit b